LKSIGDLGLPSLPLKESRVILSKAMLTHLKLLIKGYRKAYGVEDELGGYLYGFFDGLNVYICLAYLDFFADRSTGHIAFSDLPSWALECIREGGYRELGTWHTHPGYGKPQPSFEDEDKLVVREKCAIYSAKPLVDAPRFHVIFNFDASDFAVFKYDLLNKYSVEIHEIQNLGGQLSFIKVENGKIKELDSDIGLIFRTFDELIEYEYEAIEDTLGFAKIYPYPEVCQELRNLYIANFFNKVVKRSKEVKIDLSKRAWLYLEILCPRGEISKIRLFEILFNDLKVLFGFKEVAYDIYSHI